MRTDNKIVIERWLAPSLSLLVLGAIVAQNLSYATPKDAEQYHKRVRESVDRIPYTVGDWYGHDVDVSDDARRLLRPNFIGKRIYRNRATGQSIALLLVHCRDARDMGSHYPPVCYPANGWDLQTSRPLSCQAGGQAAMKAKEYEFRKQGLAWYDVIHVVDVLLLPDGTISPDISAVSAIAADYQRRYWGAGQVQVVFGERTRPAEREGVFREFAMAIQPFVEAVGSERAAEPVRHRQGQGKY